MKKSKYFYTATIKIQGAIMAEREEDVSWLLMDKIEQEAGIYNEILDIGITKEE